jgi:multisubunit Na+/H+ antiporter MnhB subunit
MTLLRPWIHSAPVDGTFILAPAWVIAALVVAFPGFFAGHTPMGDWSWGLLVIGLDVAHVYTTLFRTYFDRRERREHGPLLLLVPLFCWIGATMLHSVSAAAFWTVLAYLAVFHFIRQQYGLMMLYTTPAERQNRVQRRLDVAMIYAATLYPLIYWHAHLPRAFVWFVEGDFLPLPAWAAQAAGGLFGLILLAYVAHELRPRRDANHNLPKLLLLGGTAVSWYTGIVAFDADLAFTATNVVAHAVPYFALVWIYSANRERRAHVRRPFFRPAWVPVYVAIVVAFAYLEEGLWDGFVWREHGSLFEAFAGLPSLGAGPWIGVVAPLLILPQLTHYVLDAFIWRLRSDSTWRDTLLARRQMVQR